ncbi:hypothetical protein B5F29_14565 [Lachnoclostridium sp. An196]|jgi:hypothetical protein|uniref:hypothetical protein n=1 Tax=Lachnoclostridium sp. An196 TaxID=1965583 RepID=UPI000B379467|nr:MULTISPECIES: hypothetical protein [Clostridia]OUP16441.1 hypothetical protein B5F29_14565 [Lachnoclostridium sp. An196]
MAEKKSTISGNTEILTDANIKKEYNAIRRMFRSVKDDDSDKMKLLERIIEEVAFQKIAMKAAKADMIKNGLQTTTKNASQKFVKENPAVQTYDKYARSYASNMKTLIDMLPPKQKKEISRIMQLRGDD